MDLRRGRRWVHAERSYRPAVDFVEVRANVLDLLLARGALTTAQVVADFKGRWGAEPVMRCLRYLKDDGYIARASPRHPWNLKSRSSTEK